MEVNNIYLGNCIARIKEIESNSVDLIYFDPPFYTQKKHSLVTRDSSKKYEFSDSWESLDDYLYLIESCLIESKRVLNKLVVFFYIVTKLLRIIFELLSIKFLE